MKYVVDVHTHTIASGHAYTTWLENVKEAAHKGIKLLGTTDHGPCMPGGPNLFYFGNLKVFPRKLYGVTLLNGCEANIINFNGEIDMPELIQKKLDIIIVSMHDACIKPGTRDENTKALLGAMENPFVDIIGHSGNHLFSIYEDVIVKKAKEKNILIEINNSSFRSRPGSRENCVKIAELCKSYKTKVILGSDAHICFDIGEFSYAESILDSVNMPEDLIMNTDENKLIRYLKGKGKLQDIKLID